MAKKESLIVEISKEIPTKKDFPIENKILQVEINKLVEAIKKTNWIIKTIRR